MHKQLHSLIVFMLLINRSTSTNLIECSNWIPTWKTDCANNIVLSVEVLSKTICEKYLKSCSECRVAGFDDVRRECHLLTAFPIPVIRSPSQQQSSANQCGAHKPVKFQKMCLPLKQSENGNVTYNKTSDFEQQAHFTCHRCLIMVGHDVSSCLNGIWSDPSPICAEKELAMIPAIEALGVKAPPILNGWIVIHNREDGSTGFNKSYQSYIDGFGDIFGDFWWGLESIHVVTSNGTYRLRVEMEAYDTGVTFFQEYASFQIASATDGYRLYVNGSSGTAGDGLEVHNGKQFSTFDHDVDTAGGYNCGRIYSAGFWYSNCYYGTSGNPNGLAQACLGTSNNKVCMFWMRLSAYSRNGMRRMRMMIKS